VSVARSELDSGLALRTPRGRVFCPACAEATPEERRRRRNLLETEFADDAPVPRRVRARPSPREEARAEAADARRPEVVTPEVLALLDARVGELERAAFRMQARIVHLEEALAQARGDGGRAGA